jgi:hypothetical protein
MFSQRHRSWESSQQVSLLPVANFELQTIRIKLNVLAVGSSEKICVGQVVAMIY